MATFESLIYTCSEVGCEIGANSRGLCSTHYKRALRAGAFEDLGIRRAEGVTWHDWAEQWSTWTPSGCRVWVRGLRGGYGQIHWNGKPYPVSRFAWIQEYGEPESGLVVRHKCDNPPCFNLDHLELGTHADNSRDRISRGRQAVGSAAGTSVLSEADVLDVHDRLLAGESAPSIARSLSVSSECIYAIKSGRTWGWLTLRSPKTS